jgi:hypothetical protein
MYYVIAWNAWVYLRNNKGAQIGLYLAAFALTTLIQYVRIHA